MATDDLLEDLLDRWEEARDRGEPVAPVDLCGDHPGLAAELVRRVDELRAADAFLGGRDDPERTDSMSVRPGAPVGAGAGPPADRYHDERFLAEGGLGRVFVARDAELPREVALKRLQDRLLGSEEGRRRFVVEAEMTSRLEHPGVVPVYGLGVDTRGHPFYAMRLIRGETMARAIERFHAARAPGGDPGDRGLAFRWLLRAFLAACQTIAYAHSRGVIHRDIKPANLMLGEYGETLVVDWGLAKPVGPVAEVASPAGALPPAVAPGGIEPTADGTVKGSPAYMSPEQAAGQTDRVGPASDVYALGATLYTLLTGARPFGGATAAEVIAAVRDGRFPPPPAEESGRPGALEAVCLKAMSTDPSGRYPGALALADDVERWLSGEPVLARREPWYDRLRRWGRRHRVLVAAATAAVVVGAAVLALTNGRLRALAQRLDTSNGHLRAALDASEANLYARDLDLADHAWWDALTERAAEFLAECPEPRRGWEWRYLARRNRPGVFLATPRGGAVVALAASGADRVVTAGSAGVTSYAFPPGGDTFRPFPQGAPGEVVAISQDGGRVAVVVKGRRREAVVVDTGGVETPARVPEAAQGNLEALAFAPDGQSLAVVVARRESPESLRQEKVSFLTAFEARLVVLNLKDGGAYVSDPFTADGATGAPAVAPGGGVVCPVFYGPSGSLFAARSGSTRVGKVWPRAGDPADGGHALIASPDGRHFASGGDDDAVTVRETETGRVAAVFRGHTGRVRCLAFRRDGGRLASGGDDRTVRVWDMARREPVGVLRGHTSGVTCLAFSADGARLVSSGSGEVIVWEADHGSEARVVSEDEQSHIAELVVGPGERAAVVAGHRLAWRDARTGRGLDGPDLAGAANDALASTPLGSWTAVADVDGSIALLDASGRRARELRGHRDRVTSLSFDRAGKRLASASRDGTVRVWDADLGRELSRTGAGPGESPVVALSPDGASVAAGGDGPTVTVRESASGRVRRRLTGAEGPPVRRLAFSPDGTGLAVVRSTGPGRQGERDGDLTVWDVAAGALRFNLGRRHPGLTDAAFSPDGKRLASADRDGQVVVWEASTGRPLLTLRGPRGPISRLAFSHDGHHLVAAGGRVDPLGLRTGETSELTVWDGRPPD